MHVALVGLMGSGKTTVGRRAAKLLRRPFVDADEAFIPRYGRTVGQVFAADGESAFRGLEAELLTEVLAVDSDLLIATGGGVVVTEANRRRLSDPDVLVVYLHAEAPFLASRTRAKSDRFLLAGEEIPAVLERLYTERDALYREVASEVLEVASFHEWGSQPKKAMAERLAELVRSREVSGASLRATPGRASASELASVEKRGLGARGRSPREGTA